MKKDGGLCFLVPRRHRHLLPGELFVFWEVFLPREGTGRTGFGELYAPITQDLPGMGNGGLRHTWGAEGAAERWCGLSETGSVRPGEPARPRSCSPPPNIRLIVCWGRLPWKGSCRAWEPGQHPAAAAPRTSPSSLITKAWALWWPGWVRTLAFATQGRLPEWEREKGSQLNGSQSQPGK